MPADIAGDAHACRYVGGALPGGAARRQCAARASPVSIDARPEGGRAFLNLAQEMFRALADVIATR
jgi:hypothetical protein